MSEKSVIFHEFAGLEGIWIAQSAKLRCTAIRLSGGSLCLYSPVPGLGDEGVARLKEYGEVSVLLAPNHYHNRALAEYVQHFPTAKLVCSTDANPRLIKQTGFEFAGLDTLEADLPPYMQMLTPSGLKTGEAWIQYNDGSDVAWIVCDAFSSTPENTNDKVGRPAMLGTFPKFGIRDRLTYKAWIKSQLAHQAPTTLLPCHGPPVKRPDLGKLLDTLLDQHL